MEQLIKNNFFIRLLVLAATITAVVLVAWRGVQQPYVVQEARRVHLAAAEATMAAERADRSFKAALEEFKALNQSIAAARARLREVLQSYVAIQERLDTVDSRLYRMERLPGVLGNSHE